MKNFFVAIDFPRVIQASNTITVAGSGGSFIVDGNGSDGGRCRLLAPKSIRLLPGFKAYKGCNFRAKSFEPRLINNLKYDHNTDVNPLNNGSNYSKFVVFPNPSKGIFNIKMVSDVSIEEYSVYSVAGQLVFQSSSIENNAKFDLTDLNAGVYLLRVIHKDCIFQQTLLKQ